MPERLDLDIDGERTEAIPPAPKPVITVPDDERPADPAAEEVFDETDAVPFDEQEIPLDEEPAVLDDRPRDDWLAG